MVRAVERVREEQQPEPDHRIEVAVDRTARHSRNHVVGNGQGERRHVQPDGVVDPQAAEGRPERARQQLRREIPDWVCEQREDERANDVPARDEELAGADAQERRDELDHHQREREHDEHVDDPWKLRPLERLTETGHHQHPAGNDDREERGR